MSVSENGCTAVGMFMAVNTRQLLLYGFNTEHIYAADYMFAFADTLEVINVDDGTD
ncbi:MAG: hypothetical protein Q4F54_02160 [Coriobacteriia bacterium]|nr:hypothetical protein [Coriobacteriia bacterium]